MGEKRPLMVGEEPSMGRKSRSLRGRSRLIRHERCRVQRGSHSERPRCRLRGAVCFINGLFMHQMSRLCARGLSEEPFIGVEEPFIEGGSRL